MAAQFTLRPSLRKYLKGVDGWINFAVGLKTHSGTVTQSIAFRDGRISVKGTIPDDADIVLHFKDDDAFVDMFTLPPNEALNLVLKNRVSLDGNPNYLQLFNFLISLMMKDKHAKVLAEEQRKDLAARREEWGEGDDTLSEELQSRPQYRMSCTSRDAGVVGLEDPFLPEYCLTDFPRLELFLEDHLTRKPEICAERAKLLTHWFREHGFETDKNEGELAPEVRQGRAFKHMMSHKAPVIRKNDLLAGTTTRNEIAGATVYPDANGGSIWGELFSIDKRKLIPFDISKETIETLHTDVLPFWAKRNFVEWVRDENGSPDCQTINERWVAYFVWKTVGISHTVPDFGRVLDLGTAGIIAEIEARLNEPGLDEAGRGALLGMTLCLEGIQAYASNLAIEAGRLADREIDPARKAELESLSRTCQRVPHAPPTTLDEAFNALWIVWLGLHNENADTGLSLGRLDQLLQPFFARDLARLTTTEERQAYVKHAIELAGCFFMRCTDHFPMTPDIANFLFGGSASNQALTLGGVTPEGEDGVNDMTYIFLKVTEMLCIRDVNVNARFNLQKNSTAYLDRLCEVNFITAGTPSMHNDDAIFKSLAPHGYPIEDIRDWSATGCVEQTLSGKHMGHTGSILMNLVAGMEMALHNGYHPLMDWHLGPETGDIEKMSSFEEFFEAYITQQTFLIDKAVEYNNMLADVHARYRPTPVLSALLGGCIRNARDATSGGATHNTSGVSNIGLADITDSMLIIKKLVFDEGKVPFKELKEALDSDFGDAQGLQALVQNKIDLFGSGDEAGIEMANRIAERFHQIYNSRRNYRGGKYTAGFWSMSQHVAYGFLSGALPSGRKAGKAFTPGLSPQPFASKNFLDNICDVAKLNPEFMDNNIAFNVKLIPDAQDTREETVNTMKSYAKTYFEQGGMQIQFNVVTSETLKDAMVHPENYRNLLVRISGYNAYFVTLNREIQIELIERTEFGL
ncbi:MAG: formate acetyltransferase [bacterium]|nr:formate acetyltransferase [bacterium]